MELKYRSVHRSRGLVHGLMLYSRLRVVAVHIPSSAGPHSLALNLFVCTKVRRHLPVLAVRMFGLNILAVLSIISLIGTVMLG
jgi:hypothetical protein